MIAAFVFAIAATSLRFTGFVPPHLASDGVRYLVEARTSMDVPAQMRACGVDDFASLPSSGGATAYQFAVTRSTEAYAHCVRGRLPDGARMEKIDSWMKNAQTD